jgi:pimeloyl-ACP methyl ester carboxylesterase
MNLTVDGKVVHAGTGGREVSRDRPLLVFLHGAGMNRTVWQLQVRYFAAHGFSVLALDLPGHGESEGPPPDSVSGYAQWLGEVVSEVGNGPAHLVGTSMGAQIAWHLTGTRPDQVRSLTVLGFAERMTVNTELLTAAIDDDHLAFELMTAWGLSRRSHQGGHPTPGLWMPGATVRLLERCSPGVLANDLEACRQYDAAPLAASIDVPTLFLLGERDLMVPPRGASSLEAAVVGSRTVIVPGVGHVMMFEQPDVVIDELASFLGDTTLGE